MTRMNIEVDMPACQDHGQCVIAAPEVFRFNGQGRLEFTASLEDVSPELSERIMEAADICPLQAITVSRIS